MTMSMFCSSASGTRVARATEASAIRLSLVRRGVAAAGIIGIGPVAVGVGATMGSRVRADGERRISDGVRATASLACSLPARQPSTSASPTPFTPKPTDTRTTTQAIRNADSKTRLRASAG